MKFIDHVFPWTNKMRWAWTDDDVKLLQVIDDVGDVEKIVRDFVDTRTNPAHGGKTWQHRTCIQAGAACGVWPYRLSLLFDNVITVEPLPDNFECAAYNLRERNNVRLINGVLGNGKEPFKFVGMKQHPNERNNAGSQQVDLEPVKNGENSYPVFTIDELVEDDVVDFIALDLEGYELPALKGAQETIERCRPIIMVEDKGLSSKFGVQKGFVVDWLMMDHGYHIAEKIKRDVVLAPNQDVKL